MSGLFSSTEAFEGRGLEFWDVSKVQNMAVVFSGARGFNADLSRWNTSSATTMSGMFGNALAFDGRGVEQFDVSKVTNLAFMFNQSPLFEADLSNWNTSNAVTMEQFCTSCARFSGKGLEKWQVSRVQNFKSMFQSTEAFNADLSQWDVSSATNLNAMFFHAASFSQDLCGWGNVLVDAGNNPTVQSMFAGVRNPCESRSDPDLSATPPGPFCFVCD